mgnify:CR=1 FL=1
MGYFPKVNFMFPKNLFLGIPNFNYFWEKFGEPVKSMVSAILNLGISPKTFPKIVILKSTILWGNPTYPLMR